MANVNYCKVISSAAVVAALLWMSTTFSFATDKLAIPSEPAQQQSLELIREIYGEELGSAKTASKKQALANKFLGKAKEATDPTNRYVLLREARNLAAQAGDVDLAFFAIDEIDSHYEVDAYKLKGLAISQAAESAKGRKHLGSIAEHALPLIDQAVEKDDFRGAKYLGKLTLDSARKARAREVLKQVVTRNGEVAEIAKAYEATRDAFAKLKKEPVDPEANLAVGKYLCFLKGHWDKGLPMLALGTDEGLKKLAVKELEGASDVDGQVALGDGWWDLASSTEGVVKKQLEGRAAHWYRKALPQLTGLVKDKVERRLDKLGIPARTPTAPPELVEVPELRSIFGPCLSEDGMTIYFERTEVGKRPVIFTAHRSNMNSPFTSERQLFEGRQPVVTNDGLEMICVGSLTPDTLCFFGTTRNSVKRPFKRPRPIPGLRDPPGMAWSRGAHFSSDALTLYFTQYPEGSQKQMVFSVRHSRSVPWSKPRSLELDGGDHLHGLTTPFVTDDGLTLLCTNTAPVDWKRIMVTGNLLKFMRSTPNGRFGNPQFVAIQGVPKLIGRWPQYISATNELFFLQSDDGNLNKSRLIIVKNFVP